MQINVRRVTLGAIVFSGMAISLLPLVPVAKAYDRPGSTKLVSVSSTGGRLSADSRNTSISRTGRYIAFTTKSSALGIDGLVDGEEVFVRDVKARTTKVVSVTSRGTPGSMIGLDGVTGVAGSLNPSISGDGRYVAFQSQFPLDPADIDILWDIYVHDRKTGKTRFITAPKLADALGDNYFTDPAFSDDGRFLAFVGERAIPGISTLPKVYVYAMATSKTQLVSVSSQKEPANGGSGSPSLSADGRYVAFHSRSSNLTDDVIPQCAVTSSALCGPSIFVRDRAARKTELVSKNSSGDPGNVQAHVETGEAISDDGRYVAFYSTSTNLVPTETISPNTGPFTGDIYVHDRRTHRTERVSVDSSGTVTPVTNQGASISGNGRFVAFQGRPPGAEGNGTELGIHDRLTGATEFVTYGPEVDEAVREISLGPSGRLVAFATSGDKHAPRDTNGRFDVFLHDRGDHLGIGELAQGSNLSVSGSPAFARTGIAAATDPVGDVSSVLSGRGLNLIGARIVHRPRERDLFVSVAVQYMPQQGFGPSAASPDVVYGLRFETRGKRYEMRATSVLRAAFDLFDCTASTRSFCTKIADLEGGYGTTGDRVVVSLPLRKIGLQRGGRIANGEAFTAMGVNGSLPQPEIQIVDRVFLDRRR